MVGAKDFTLIGRPLIQSGLANVHATVIEKTLSHTKTHFRKKRRKQYKRIHCKFKLFITVNKIILQLLFCSLSNSANYVKNK